MLARIFRAFDRDADGLLRDTELNDLQSACFNSELQVTDITKTHTHTHNHPRNQQ